MNLFLLVSFTLEMHTIDIFLNPLGEMAFFSNRLLITAGGLLKLIP